MLLLNFLRFFFPNIHFKVHWVGLLWIGELFVYGSSNNQCVTKYEVQIWWPYFDVKFLSFPTLHKNNNFHKCICYYLPVLEETQTLCVLDFEGKYFAFKKSRKPISEWYKFCKKKKNGLFSLHMHEQWVYLCV